MGRQRGALNRSTRIIRDAIMELTELYKVITVRGVFYQLEGIVPKEEAQGRRVVPARDVDERACGSSGNTSGLSASCSWNCRSGAYDGVDNAERPGDAETSRARHG